MDRDRFIATIRFFRKQVPFKPFTVSLMNGEQYEVDFADAFTERDGLGMYAAPGGFPVVFDHESVSKIIGDLKTQPEAA